MLLIPPRDGNPFLERVERIELRFEVAMDAEFEKWIRMARLGRRVDALRERLLPLMVLVGPDGEERKVTD